MTIRVHGNNFKTTLSAAIVNPTDLTMTLTSVTGAPTVGSNIVCFFTLTDGTNYEIVKATALSTNTYTITRGEEGTTAQSWANGSTVTINTTRDSTDLKLDKPTSLATWRIYAGPATTTDVTQQISHGSVAGSVLTWASSSALPTFTTINGLTSCSPVTANTIIHASSGSWTTLGPNTSGTKYLASIGPTGALSYAQVSLTAGVTGILPSVNGGSGVSISPCFCATRTGSEQAFSTSVYTKVQLNNEVFDNNSNFDNVTNYRFTPTVAGKYVFCATVAFPTSSMTTGALLICRITKNSGTDFKYNFMNANGTGQQSVSTSVVFDMNGTTDYVELYGYMSAGPAPKFDDSDLSSLSGARICE